MLFAFAFLLFQYGNFAGKINSSLHTMITIIDTYMLLLQHNGCTVDGLKLPIKTQVLMIISATYTMLCWFLMDLKHILLKHTHKVM